MNQPEIFQLLQEAVSLHNQGELDRAEAIYRHVLAIDANNFYALRFLGCLCRLRGMYDQGIPFLVKASKQRPSDKDVLYNLANIYMDSGSHQKAVDVFEDCLSLDGDFAEALMGMGCSLLEIGRTHDSYIALKKSIDINPDLFQSWFNLGNTLRVMELLPAAIDSYRKVIELKPDCAEAYLNLGNILRQLGDISESIECYYMAIQIKPDFYIALSSLATTLMEIGRHSESLYFYERCSLLNPWDPCNYELPAKCCDSLAVSLRDNCSRDLALDLYLKSFSVRPVLGSFVFEGKASSSYRLNISDVIPSLPDNAELLPSFQLLDEFRNLSLYCLHIPKNGGIRFTLPLQECIRCYENSLFNGKFEAWKEVVDLQHSYKRLTALRLNNQSLHDAFLNHISSCEPDLTVDWSLVMSHGSWSSILLQNYIADVTGQMPIRVGVWREPRSRFISALHYLYREAGGSFDRVVNDLTTSSSFLHNSIYRHVADCIDGDLSEPSEACAVDYLLDLGENSLVNQLQSSFLTRNHLPNLIVSKRFNVTKADFRMSAADEDRLLNEFPIDDFVYMDESDFVNSLRVSKLPAALSCHSESDVLHPLTVIVSDSTDQRSSIYHSEICLTSELVSPRGHQKLQKIFDGKNAKFLDID